MTGHGSNTKPDEVLPSLSENTFCSFWNLAVPLVPGMMVFFLFPELDYVSQHLRWLQGKL